MGTAINLGAEGHAANVMRDARGSRRRNSGATTVWAAFGPSSGVAYRVAGDHLDVPCVARVNTIPFAPGTLAVGLAQKIDGRGDVSFRRAQNVMLIENPLPVEPRR